MPELPEVEYTARQLRASVVGATIAEALVFWERTIGHPDPADFMVEVADRQIEGVGRRGKFLVIELGGDLIMTIHRRMTGNLLLLPPGWEVDTSLRERDPVAWNTRGPTFRKVRSGQANSEAATRENEREENDPDLLYCRVCFNLADGRRLLYSDLRKFGRIELWPRDYTENAGAPIVSGRSGGLPFRSRASHEKLGLEPLSEEFTVERLMQDLAGRKRAIKQVLLVQEVVAGLGNIYADEALFYASIHPLRRANSLTFPEVQLLHEGIVEVLSRGIERGGTSFSNYRDLWGEAGNNYDHMLVYHRQGKPCVRCGTLVERILVGQRSTHYCPTCQRLTEE